MDLHKIASKITANYHISLGGGHYVSDEQVLAELKKIHKPEAKRSIESIEEIMKKGIRYSNQDFDILSHAIDVLNKNGVDLRKGK